jgi:cytochrome oxidase Cu insertion factor (SCO1/SenC/PrrC family)
MKPARKLAWLIWAGLLVVTTGLLIVVLMASLRLRGRTAQPLPVISQVADFTLTNQNHQPVTLHELRGRVWVADIIFTRCAGPCPRMTQQLRSLQKALPPQTQARLVTLTTDPTFDTPDVLRQYAARFEADLGNWMFLTGDPQQIARLATESLKLAAVEVDPDQRQDPADLFIHSTYFVLVDKLGRLRAVYDTSDEAASAGELNRKVLEGIRRLEAEP